MRRLLILAMLGLLGGSAASGCVVRERRTAHAGYCRGGYWVEGHYGRLGRWHPGHWRCPGVVERVDID